MVEGNPIRSSPTLAAGVQICVRDSSHWTFNMGLKLCALLLLMWIMQSSQEAVLNEHLVALSTDASGTAAVFVAGRQGRYDHANYLFTSGEGVSPACSASDRTRRCRKLLVIGSGETYIVLAPLQNAVGLTELRYDGRELFKIGDFTLSITYEFQIENCVPLDIISFEGRRIVLCLENLRTLRSCDIQLNRTDISQSILKHCLSLHNFPDAITEADYRFISNFVSYPTLREVVFVLRGVVYGIRYHSFNAHPFVSLGDATCDHLQYAGNDRFYAYCASGQTKVFNTDTSLVVDAGILIPFTCPQTDETFFKVQQTDRDTIIRYNDRTNYRTPGVNFTTGECYNPDTFLFVDSSKGTKAFCQSSGSFIIISNSSRDRNLVVFDGPYLAVYRTDPPELLLYDPSFLLIAVISLDVAVAVAVIADLSITLTHTSSALPVVSPTPITPSTPPKGAAWYTKGGGIALWIGLGLIIFAVVIIVVVFSVVLLHVSRRHRLKQESYRIQPMGDHEGCVRNTPEGQDVCEDNSGSSSSSIDSDNNSAAGTRDSTIDGKSGDEDDDDDTFVTPVQPTS